MDHRIDGIAVKNIVYQGRVAYIAVNKFVLCEGRQPSQVRQIPGVGQGIQVDYLRSRFCCAEVVDKIRSDEPGPASDKNAFHPHILITRIFPPR
jgi:hypothetical protein